MKRRIEFRSYKEFFSDRLREISVSLKVRPKITMFYTEETDNKRKKHLITLYNLNLRLLKIFDKEEKRHYL